MAIKTYYLLKKYIDTAEKNLPFYVEDVSGQSSTLTLTTSNSDATNIEYSTDNVTWSSTKPSIPANGRVYIRANATYWNTNSLRGQPYCYSSHNYNVGGNIMSLLYGSNFTGAETAFPDPTKQYIFCMFLGCNSTYGWYGLKSAEKLVLPATAPYCYAYMFQYCYGLTTAPHLPATTLAGSCYYYMFNNCTALVNAPDRLPATTLVNGCYTMMFGGCSNLVNAPALPATTLANGCYNSMFQQCTSLVTAPTLPATTLVDYCYSSMFNGCSNLNSVTVRATSWNTHYTYNWLEGVSATGTFTKPTNTTIPTGNGGIPSGWTVVNV